MTHVSSETPEESTSTRLRAKEFANALSHLNPRMRRVLALRFGLDGETAQTLEEVGAGLGITRERVRQLESRASAWAYVLWKRTQFRMR